MKASAVSAQLPLMYTFLKAAAACTANLPVNLEILMRARRDDHEYIWTAETDSSQAQVIPDESPLLGGLLPQGCSLALAPLDLHCVKEPLHCFQLREILSIHAHREAVWHAESWSGESFSAWLKMWGMLALSFHSKQAWRTPTLELRTREHSAVKPVPNAYTVLSGRCIKAQQSMVLQSVLTMEANPGAAGSYTMELNMSLEPIAPRSKQQKHFLGE